MIRKPFPYGTVRRKRDCRSASRRHPSPFPKCAIFSNASLAANIIYDHLARPESWMTARPVQRPRSCSTWLRSAISISKFRPAPSRWQRPESPRWPFSGWSRRSGADHILFGSNLPANEGTMSDLVGEGHACLASLSQADRAMIFSGTAKHLYSALR